MDNKISEALVIRLADSIYENSCGIVEKRESVEIAYGKIDHWIEAGKEYPHLYHKGVAWYGQQIAHHLIRDRIDKLCSDDDGEN